jgi:hypothetical protein
MMTLFFEGFSAESLWARADIDAFKWIPLNKAEKIQWYLSKEKKKKKIVEEKISG